MKTELNANRALWEKGDFTRIAATMRGSGEALVATLEITPGLRVLDVGCGDGTTAIPAARLGADVLGVDIASNLVAAGNARAVELGVSNVRFEQGDVSALTGLETGRFDLALSIFGAMFAPRPFDVAAELVRVVRPGGRIVMGNWIPGDPTFVAQILKISGAYSPVPPEGFVSPMLWGIESDVTERFGAAGIPADGITFERRTYDFEFVGTPDELLDVFIDFYGPTMNAFDAARTDGRDGDLRAELSTMFDAQNTSPTPGRTSIPATFLHVSITR